MNIYHLIKEAKRKAFSLSISTLKKNILFWMIINLSSKVNRYNFAGLQLIDKVLFNKRITHDAGWSSLVARRAHNPKVVGSNPTPATNDRPSFLFEKWGFLFCREVYSNHV